jgi:hypothetical protein
MEIADGINRAGRLWLLGNSATLRDIGREGYASRGRGCVTVRLAPSGRPIDEPQYRPAAEMPAVDRVAAEAADGAASYDPERLTLVLVEQERAPTCELLLLGDDGTALDGMEAVRTRAILENWARTFHARHGRGVLRVRFPGGVEEDAGAFEFTTLDAALAEFGADSSLARDLAVYDPRREALVMIDDPTTGTAAGHRALPFAQPDDEDEAGPPGVARSADGPLLSARERAVLADAATQLVDECLDDLARILAAPRRRLAAEVAESQLASLLPPRYLPRYVAEPSLLARFYHCLAAVTWRLAQPAWLPLSCVAEQLALRGIIDHAEALLELRLDARHGDPQGRQERHAALYAPGPDDEDAAIDFAILREVLARDDDIAFLFDERFDGIDQSVAGQLTRMASLQLADWFTPFEELLGVVAPSPFAREVTRDAGGLAGEGFR